MHQSHNESTKMTVSPAVAAGSSAAMRATDSRESDNTVESGSSDASVDNGVSHDAAPASGEADGESAKSALRRTVSFIYRHSNFYRVHLACFTLIPLIFACIFWSIDKNDTSFVDALFVCVSAMTVTGLNPLLMEEIRPSQQALTFILLFIGSSTGPSLVTLLIRRHYFGKRFAKLMQTDPAMRKRVQDLEELENRNSKTRIKIRPEMIKRVDEPIPLDRLLAAQEPEEDEQVAEISAAPKRETTPDFGSQARLRRASDPAPPLYHSSDANKAFSRARTMDQRQVVAPGTRTERTLTIGIQEPNAPERALRKVQTTAAAGITGEGLRKRKTVISGQPLHRTPARRPSLGNPEPFDGVLSDAAMGSGYGGFPNPVKAVASAVHRRIVQGQTSNGFDRSVTLQSVHSRGGLSNVVGGGRTRSVNYISFDAVVSGNSQFHDLTAEQKEELGGIEYRAISLLTKVVATYWILVQFVPVLIIAPIFATGKYDWIFSEGQGTVTNQAGWYAVFNLCSCYANAGLSLLDESMGLFTESYAYVLVCGFLILAGNTAFPVFLRLVIWAMSKLVPSNSRTKETLQFLLDHPRRCFIYLFPSHQTWLLLLLIVLFTSTDWVAFLVLDIGNPVVWGLAPAARAIDSLFQSISVRTAGFSITTLSALAPAVLVLYIVMMYLAIYPLALSVRTTNVYEEQAMGILPASKDDSDEMEERFNKTRRAGGYFAYHARKQLAFDVWWLGFALWAVCIVERDGIQDGERPWLNIFSILFECTSAYGTVGLSLGVPYAAFSLVGDMRTLSKLIIIVVMIRGRHRALPLAIDRSIMLPSDLDIHMGSRSSTQSSRHSDRSITRDGHVIPNLGKTQATGPSSMRGNTNALL